MIVWEYCHKLQNQGKGIEGVLKSKMGKIEQKLKYLGLNLVTTTNPLAKYVPVKQSGNLVFTAGHLPMVNGELVSKGILGQDVDINDAKNAAKICTLNALAATKELIGELDRIKQVVKVVGYVASTPSFNQQPFVINGASEILIEIFGSSGEHARSAVGMASLPLNACVEIELILEVQ